MPHPLQLADDGVIHYSDIRSSAPSCAPTSKRTRLSLWSFFCSSRGVLLPAILFALCASGTPCQAGYAYFDHDCSYTFDGGFGNEAPEIGWSGNGIVHQASQTPQLDWHHTFTNNNNTSTADMGLGYYGDSCTLIASIAKGTKVTQDAPDGGNDPATLNFWSSVMGSAYGMNLSPMINVLGWYNVPVVATLQDEGYAQVHLKVEFHGLGASPWDYTRTDDWFCDTPGTSSGTLSNVFSLPNIIPELQGNGYAYLGCWIKAELTYTVKNDGGPVGFSLPEGFLLNMQGEDGAVPEPSTNILLATAAIALLGSRCRKPPRTAPSPRSTAFNE